MNLKIAMCDHLAFQARKTVEDGEYFQRVLFNSPDLQLVTMSLYPGQCVPWRSHCSSVVMYVVSGNVRVSMNDACYEMSTDDGLALPPNHNHMIRNIGNCPAKLMVHYSGQVLSKCHLSQANPSNGQISVIRQ